MAELKRFERTFASNLHRKEIFHESVDLYSFSLEIPEAAPHEIEIQEKKMLHILMFQ